QPCVSPVWDTCLTAHTLLETGDEDARAEALEACEWLAPLQVLDVKGDWAAQRPDVRPGGWAFQYANAYYPDVDDTAVVVTAMDRLTAGDGSRPYDERIARAKEWIVGMQSKNGGWGAFDADNTCHYLNHIPFADHGALLDPPTADVSARCVSMLAQLGDTIESSECLKRGVDYLLKEQEKDGSWFGRWGANYIYGTWSTLCALNAVGLPHEHDAYRRAVAWLVTIQNEDGGWGEDLASYKLDYKGYEKAPSTASQTAWALLALMAAGDVDHPAVARGIAYLQSTQNGAGLWNEARFTATGFPRVFYLRYHGYGKFFPLWALARYRNLKRANSKRVQVGL
ncbi:squalene--hopene cyclase, partial [Methylocystis sp.]|uniref:squalene--hopene cyclase n=1 Tax=Methylocystis sp. TaxID=1911079 RepID=UPI003DA2953E